MIEYWRGKNILNVLLPLRIMEEKLQELENSKHEMKKKVFIIVLFDFQFPALEVPSS